MADQVHDSSDLQIDAHEENDHEKILQDIDDTRDKHEVDVLEVHVSSNQLEENHPQQSSPVADPASKQSSQQKKEKKIKPITEEYKLSWFGLWWRMMEREGVKLDKARLLMMEKGRK